MNCEDCQNLASRFLDNELEERQAELVQIHLGTCVNCQRMYEELTAILNASLDLSESTASFSPPNSQALWCRIRNLIERDTGQFALADEQASKDRSFRLSWMQFSAALVCIALISSLLTFVVIRNYNEPTESNLTSRSVATQSTFEKIMSRLGLMDTPQQARERRLREQYAAIEYWDARVQQRRSQWNRATREAFDRNLQVINDAVNEYTLILEQNPDDDLSSEMLDSVLSEKVSLLRDFADL